MQAPERTEDSSNVVSPAEDDIRAWATDVVNDAAMQGGDTGDTVDASRPASSSKSYKDGIGGPTLAHEAGDSHIDDAANNAANDTPVSGGSAEQSVRYFVLRSSTRAAITHALGGPLGWQVTEDLGKRLLKAIKEDQTVIVFLGADDTQHFVACAHVTGVKGTGPDSSLTQTTLPLVSLSSLLATGNRSSMSSLGSGPSFSETRNMQNARQYKERALEASIWNLTKEEMAFQRRRAQLMGELVQLRQQGEVAFQVEVSTTSSNSPASKADSAKSANKISSTEQTSGQDSSSANEGASKGSQHHSPSSSRSRREKNHADAHLLHRTVHTQAWNASKSKSLVAELGTAQATNPVTPSKETASADTGSSSNISLRADVPSDTDSSRKVSSDAVPSNVAGAVLLSSTPETSRNLEPDAGGAQMIQAPGTVLAKHTGSTPDKEGSSGLDYEEEPGKQQDPMGKAETLSSMTLNVLLMNPLPFTTVATEHVRNKWHSTFSLRQQPGRSVHKVPDGTELAPETGYELLLLWTKSDETPICPSCGRHWTVAQSGMSDPTTDSEILSDSPSDNDRDSGEPRT